MANWTQLRSRLHELETAVGSGDVAAQLRAGGMVATATAELLHEPRTRTDGRRDSGDVLGGDCYRSCDVILDQLRTDPHAVAPGNLPWDGTFLRILLEFLKELLKR